MSRDLLLQKITGLLQGERARMFSREEILNLLSDLKSEPEIEHLLAELEVASSGGEDSKADVYATCRGGTVYYRWNKSG